MKIFREVKKDFDFFTAYRLDYTTHIHESIELIFVKRGGGMAFCNGKKYILTENSFFLVFPNKIHRYEECLPGEYIILIVKPSVLLKYSDIFLKGEPVSALHTFENEKDDNIIYLLETALKEFNRDGRSSIIDAYLTAFFGKLIKFYTINKCNLSQDTVLQILKCCADNYKENITV